MSYDYGSDVHDNPGRGNVFVAWIENPSESFLQNIIVCEKLTNNSLSGDALPFWTLGRYPECQTEADAMASATKARQDVTVDFTLDSNAPDTFTLYFETDRSSEYNDWFPVPTGGDNYVSDQPALLYKADIDLNTATDSWTLEFVGWTPNSDTPRIIPMTNGNLYTETRYITHHKSGTSFGTVDSVQQSSKMVGPNGIRLSRIE